ncbi:hypothetical protein KCP71_07760 [Salmonella enterica subsp. enterica]|nr:hypothetical protein KCP71_07760 [Salmonella enterica subsp. enterica]
MVLTPDEVVHPRFSGRRASFVRPASMERACGSVRGLQLRVRDVWISITL